MAAVDPPFNAVGGATDADERRPRPGAILAWVAYGMAGAGYQLMAPAIGYAAYFRTQVAAGRGDADAIWGGIVALALVIAGLLGPVLGAYADRAGRRRQLLFVATLASLLFTAGLATVTTGALLRGALLFLGAHTAFLSAKAIYDSFLLQLGTRRSLAMVSALGMGLGYLGSLLFFAISFPLIRDSGEIADPARFRLMFLVVAAFMACLALPAIFALPARPARGRKAESPLREAIREVARTLRHWQDEREVFKFLHAFYLINDGVVTFVLFVGIFLQATYGLLVQAILELTLLFYAIAAPGTVLLGWLAQHWSERGALQLTLAVWLLLIGVMVLGTGQSIPLAIAVLAGLVVGSTQALCRSLYARMIPVEKTSEFFGFNALIGRGSAALGPLCFGLVSAVTGSPRAAMASLAIVFLVGAYVLASVRPHDRQEVADRP